METRDFFYLSKPKIDLIYDQNKINSKKTVSKEIKGTVSVVSGKITTEETSEDNYYSKLQYIERELEMSGQMGKLTTPGKKYIKDDLKLDWSMNEGLSLWRSWYYDSSNHIFYRLLMYGSISNVVPYARFDFPCYAGSCFFEVITSLDTAIKKHLDKSTEIKEYVEKSIEQQKQMIEQQKQMRTRGRLSLDIFNGYYLDVDQKWQIIEALYTTRDVRDIKGYNRMQRVLARVDYRETITREYYRENFIKRFGVREEPGFLPTGRRYAEFCLGVPKDAEYIVYIYASPVAVEYIKHNVKIHIINNEEYLYISDHQLNELRKKYPSQPDFVDCLVALLNENELFSSGYYLKKEYYGEFRENSWNNIPDAQLSGIINKYITNIPSL